MAIQAQDTKLNVVPGGIIPVVHVSQHDVNRTLTFSLYDGNSVASLASGTTALIEGTKPDNHGFEYAATLSGNVVTVNTTEQMTVLEGIVECKIVLKQGTQTIGTALFLMEVEKAGLADDVDISETDIPVLVDLATEQMETAEAWAKGTRSGVPVTSEDESYHNNSKYYAEQAADSASTAVTSAANSATSAETSRRWAIGVTDDGTNPSDTNNSKYYAGRSEHWYEEVLSFYNEINSLLTLISALFGTLYFVSKSGDRFVTKGGDALTVKY